MNLRAFLQELESKSPEEIWRIPGEIEPGHDITALVLELERRGEHPVLWFEKVRGSRFPVVTNVFGHRRRYARALGVPLESLHDEWMRRGERRLAPVLCQSGPVREVVKTGAEVDLSELPIIDHFTEDAGPYITNGIVVAKDPDTGVRNASFHRMELRGRNRVGTSLHSRRHLWDYQRRAEERGEALAVAVVIGAHPLFHFGSGLWKGPIDADEYEVAGRILSGTREPEGPFAEFTGYASERSTQHVIEVSAITHRRDALYQDIVGGISAEHTQLLAVPQEARMLKVLRGHYPSVRAVSYPHSGTCRLHCYVSMKPSAEGQAKNAAMTAFGEDLALKLVVVVDDDVDVFDEEEVLWALATRMQADRDVFIVPNMMGAILDPSTRAGTTAKMAIDATRPLGEYPRRHTLPAEARTRAQALIEARRRL